MKSFQREAQAIETSESKIKGRLGELSALDYFARNSVMDKKYVSLTNVFKDMGCEILSDYLKDGKDAGIDDIFVIQTGNRSGFTPDFRTTPIFHESKFSSRCQLILPDTKTMCQQMSFDWLTKNLDLAMDRYRKTERAKISIGNRIINVQSCTQCSDSFKDTIKWLKRKVKSRKIIRTASVLCPNGEFTLYIINE